MASTPSNKLRAFDIGSFTIEPYGRGMGSRTWLVRADKALFVAKAVRGLPQFERGLEAAEVVEATGLAAGARPRAKRSL